MEHHHTQELDYKPYGLCSDSSVLTVYDPSHYKIHRYTHDGKTVIVINLGIMPLWVSMTRHSDQYIVINWRINQILMIDGRGKVKKSYQGKIHGVDFGKPRGVRSLTLTAVS